jgi:acyl dehydratase
MSKAQSQTTTGLTRVDRDPGGAKRTTFDDIEPGADLGEMTWSVSRAQVAGLIANDLDFHEWYEGKSPFGGPVVPPLATYPPVRILFARKFNVRGVFYHYESEFLRPIFYDQVLKIRGRVTDKWVKREREFVRYEAEGIDEQGRVVFKTRRTHALDYIPRTAPREGVGVDSGAAQKSRPPETAQ